MKYETRYYYRWVDVTYYIMNKIDLPDCIDLDNYEIKAAVVPVFKTKT